MTQIQLRRATASSWTSVNPILAVGEVGIETDTRKLKVGDGATQWTGLSYTVVGWSDINGKPTDLVTLTGTETLSGKTISGASNTITNLPASATPDASRLVCETAPGLNGASDGTGAWVKLATISSGTAQNQDLTATLVVNAHGGSVAASATVVVSLRSNATNANPTVNVLMVSNSDTTNTVIPSNGFKLISGGWGADAELWFRKDHAFGAYRVYELAVGRQVSVTISYPTTPAWQSATPTGTVNNVSTNGVTVLGVPVVTTTSVQSLSNKTLTNPTVNAYTEGVVAVGTVTSSHTLAITAGTVITATLTASTACTFTMPTAGAGKSFVLLLKQAASTGNGTATFTGVKWGGGTAPTITATAGRMDILSFVSDGTNWYGTAAQNFTP